MSPLGDRLVRRHQRILVHRLLDLGELDVPGEAEDLQGPDPDPVMVELVPGQAVACAGRVRVMVVVPSLAEGQERYPPVVRRVVARLEPTRAPPVRGGVD